MSNIKQAISQLSEPEKSIGEYAFEAFKAINKGFTHTKDMNGDIICLGDNIQVAGSSATFKVVFENNAFRKKYKRWDKTLEKPILESGQQMNYEVISS